MFHDKSKHIEMKYHFIRDMVQGGVVRLQYIATNEHITDMLNKTMSMTKCRYFQEKIGMAENSSLNEREC